MSEYLVRRKGVLKQVPISGSTLYLWISRGDFPRPISLGGRAVAWRQSEIDDWIAKRIEGGWCAVAE